MGRITSARKAAEKHGRRPNLSKVQTPSRRKDTAASGIQNPRTSTTRPRRQENSEILCLDCDQMDLEKAFTDADAFFSANWDLVLGLRAWSEPRFKFDGLLVTSLGGRLARLSSSCPLCRFMSTFSLDGSSEGPFELRAFPSFWALPFIKLKASVFRNRYRQLQEAILMVVPVGTKAPAASDAFSQAKCIFRAPTSAANATRGKEINEFIDLDQVLAWINFCTTHHGRGCPKPRKRRNIEVSQSIQGFCLINCDTENVIRSSIEEDFVALSYVWGDTTHEAVSSESAWPRVIQDAVTVTKMLGMRYLWVDRYCIDQSNNDEKHQQIAHMNLIYQSAQITIIAAAGKDANHGLPGVSMPRKKTPRVTVGKAKLVGLPDDAHNSVRASAWWSRGWTYQEGVLSKRRLVFTHDQAYYECEGMVCYECFHYPAGELHTQLKLNQESFVKAGLFNGVESNNANSFRLAASKDPGRQQERLFFHIKNYCHRMLSFNSDSLDAFRGILTAHKQKSFYGLSVSNIFPHPKANTETTKHLLSMKKCSQELSPELVSWWHCAGPKPPQRVPAFPSWSWAGWRGHVETHKQNFTPPLPISRHSIHPLDQKSPEFEGPYILLEMRGSGHYLRVDTALSKLESIEGDFSPILEPVLWVHGARLLDLQAADDLTCNATRVPANHCNPPSHWNGQITVSIIGGPHSLEIDLHMHMSVDITPSNLVKHLKQKTYIPLLMSRTADCLLFVVLALHPAPKDTQYWERVGLCHSRTTPIRQAILHGVAILSSVAKEGLEVMKVL
ncbi:heterokaryon incompatibility protein-domain-containing protein [Podospora didyma]|uniref:Heterokaryon incompatibility protein-domain-containing protein n=1 Tax=Podospora didyma TaxID=330526 RepID=A0AAE0NPX9_9PEZI|nr:heterokaryon incompatibility protein-domain-containing protein [Podospora didyma]